MWDLQFRLRRPTNRWSLWATQLRSVIQQLRAKDSPTTLRPQLAAQRKSLSSLRASSSQSKSRGREAQLPLATLWARQLEWAATRPTTPQWCPCRSPVPTSTRASPSERARSSKTARRSSKEAIQTMQATQRSTTETILLPLKVRAQRRFCPT